MSGFLPKCWLFSAVMLPRRGFVFPAFWPSLVPNSTFRLHPHLVQAYGGMRGIKCMVTETSVLDPEEGIRYGWRLHQASVFSFRLHCSR